MATTLFVWQWCWRAQWRLQELQTPKCGLGKKFPLWIKTANQKNQQKINSLNQIQIRVSSWGTISCHSLGHFLAVLFSERPGKCLSFIGLSNTLWILFGEGKTTPHNTSHQAFPVSRLSAHISAHSYFKAFLDLGKKTYKSLGLFIRTKLFSVYFTSYQRPVQAFSSLPPL